MKRKTNHYIMTTLLSLLFFLPCVGYTAGEISFISNLGGSARHSAMDGSYLYSLIGDRLFVADISNIEKPVELSALPLPDRARRLVLSDQVVYIACSRGGLVAVDVSDPYNPVLLDTLTFDSPTQICNTFGIAVQDQHAYVADHTGMHVVDIADPSAMGIVSSYTDFDTPHHLAYDVYVNGDFAYISCEMDGLYIVDISTPETPVRVSAFKDATKELGQFYQSMRYGDYLLIAGGIAGLVVLDVSDITAPVYVTNIDKNYQGVLAIAKKGDYVYLCTEFDNLFSIDISDIQNPEQVQEFDLEGHHSLGIALHDGTLMLANSTFGIRLLDVSTGTIQPLGGFKSIGRVVDCHAVGDYAYVAAGGNGLQVLNLQNPVVPKAVAMKKTEGYAEGIFVDGSLVYVAVLDKETGTSGFLEVFDISVPANPLFTGSIEVQGAPYDVVVEGSTAYLSCRTNGVILVDISDPTNLSIRSAYNTKGIAYKPALWGNIMMVADGGRGLVFLDIKDKEHPKYITTLRDIGNIQDVSLWSTFAFLPAGSGGLHAADISRPYSPEIIRSIAVSEERKETGLFNAVETFDNYLLVADRLGLRLYDIKTGDTIQEIDYFHRFIGDPIKLTYDRSTGRAFVSSQISGLYIFDINVPEPAETQIEGSWIGSGVKDGMLTGITLNLMQSHSDVFSDILFVTNRKTSGVLSGKISGTAITGEVIFEGNSAVAELHYDPMAGTITGSIGGEFTVNDIYLEYSGVLGHNDILGSLISLSSAIDKRLAETDKMLEKMLLPVAQPFVDTAMEESVLSKELSRLSPAESLLSLAGRNGAVAAADNRILDSVIWETHILKSISDNYREDICQDYKFALNVPGAIADAAFDMATQRENLFLTPQSLRNFWIAGLNYERVIDRYATFKPRCPSFGVEKFDGYYEGTIDFLGIISGSLYACVEEDEAGNVTGDVFIVLEASREYLNGTLVDGFNDTDTGESVLTGTIQVRFGEITAHIILEGWKYDVSARAWVGEVEVVEQRVKGSVMLQRASDTCPDGWDEI